MADFRDNIVDKETFEQVLEKDPYYKGRWGYFNEVISQLRQLEDVHTVLEFGPYKLPFVKGSDIIDLHDDDVDEYPFEIGKFIAHDCSDLPLPIEDKSYDLVIACQVIEHFGIFGEQKTFFDELERISRKAIVSLPYKWFRPYLRDHHMIDENVIKYWSSNRAPVFEMISGTPHSARILQVYDFESDSAKSKVESEYKFRGYIKQSIKIDEEMNKLREKIDELSEDRKQLKEERKNLQKDNNKLNSDLWKLKKENKKLKQQNKNLGDELNIIKSSNSWKLTAPIRNIRSKFK